MPGKTAFVAGIDHVEHCPIGHVMTIAAVANLLTTTEHADYGDTIIENVLIVADHFARERTRNADDASQWEAL